MLDAPAGKHGFLQRKGEHFQWSDGTRARFWGINVANTSLMESDAQIASIIENFRSSGFNMLRMHHFDEREGIIDLTKPDSRHFDQARLRKIDYWIYQAKKAGIYVYLDLLDYRHFKAGDGVPNAEAIGRAARPYAVFDEKLRDLQKEYARKLLREHVNPYTKLAYADDPAIVLLEIYDESGLFMRRDVWRTMPQPYAANFQTKWNRWLKTKYKTTGALEVAWTDQETGNNALQPSETLEKGTVQVPAMTWTPQNLPAAQKPYATQARLNDGALFATSLHEEFFRDMKSYLKSIGVKVPISATGRFDDLADLRGLGKSLDFIGANFYYDHPYWGSGKPAWTPPSYFHNSNPVSHVNELSMAATISLARVRGVPLVVREWNYCWPNRNRAGGMIEAAAYAALHDVDAMILFVYEMKPTPRVSYFNVRSDPSRWGLTGIGAQIFLGGLVQPAKNRIVIPYNTVDTYTYQRYHQPLYALAWTTRVENDFYDGPVYKNNDPNTLLVSPGRSGVGKFEGAPSVMHTESLRKDLTGRTITVPEYMQEYGLKPVPAGPTKLRFNDIMFDAGAVRERDLQLALSLPKVNALGGVPIGVNRDSGVANGFLDRKNKRFVFGDLEREDILRASMDALQTFYDVPNSHDATEHNVFKSDTGELWRDAASGRLIVSAPGVQSMSGNLNSVGRVLAPGLRVRNAKNGTLVALALDGKPLVSSQKFLIKMVNDVENVDEKLARDPRFASKPDGQWKLDVLGDGPVKFGGIKSAEPIQIAIENRPLVDVYLEGGGFELYVDGDKWSFYCDTPGTKFTLYKPNKNVTATFTAGTDVLHYAG